MKKVIELLASTSLIVGAEVTTISCKTEKDKKENISKELEIFFKDFENKKAKDRWDISSKLFDYIIVEKSKLEFDHILKTFYPIEAEIEYIDWRQIIGNELLVCYSIDMNNQKIDIVAYRVTDPHNELVEKIGQLTKKFKLES